MHPEVVVDHPGTCPIGGMDLVPLTTGTGAPTDDGQTYTCSMHPQVVADHPGTCPICGMDLVPQRPSEPEYVPMPQVALPCVGADCEREAVRALLEAAVSSADAMLAGFAVSAMPDDRLPALLADPRGLVRLYAAVAVGERNLVALRTPVRAAIQDARDDPMAQARLAAIGAAAKLGDEEGAAAALRPWLRDERSLVRLVALAYADDLPALRETVAQMAQSDASPDVRDQAELILALLGDASARRRVLARTDQASFRVQMTLDADRARPLLLRALAQRQDDPEMDFIIRSSAASALLSAGDERGRRALHEMLAQSDAQHRLALLQSLHSFATRADLAVVEPLLASTDDATRVQAAATWWKITQPRR